MLPLVGIVAGAVVAGFAASIPGLEKAERLDERALKKLARAYERRELAAELVKNKEQELETALRKVMNRKMGVLSTSIKDFVDVYNQILRINFNDTSSNLDMSKALVPVDDVSVYQSLAFTPWSGLSDKEAATALIFGVFGGIGRGAAKEAERNLANANRQLRAANSIYEQAENIATSFDLMINECHAVADIVAKLNVFLIRSIKTSKSLIVERGYDASAYSQQDRDVLMTCMNLAQTIKQLIDAPILTKDNEITREVKTAVEIGQTMQKALQG